MQKRIINNCNRLFSIYSHVSKMFADPFAQVISNWIHNKFLTILKDNYLLKGILK